MKVYIKFFTYLFLKSFFYVMAIMLSLVFILNLLSELEFFKNIEVSSYFPLFLSLKCIGTSIKFAFNFFINHTSLTPKLYP